MTKDQSPTDLPIGVRRLVELLVETLDEGRHQLSEQAKVARATHLSATKVGFVVPKSAPVAENLPDGPLLDAASVYIEGELTGEVLLWVEGGRLCGLEQSWFTDDPPRSWPDLGSVSI